MNGIIFLIAFFGFMGILAIIAGIYLNKTKDKPL